MSAALRWKALYEAALRETNPPRLRSRLLGAEVAMTGAAEEMLNEKNNSESYDDLLEAMRTLYEHALRKGVNIPRGTFK
jgi:hypothetical protein